VIIQLRDRSLQPVQVTIEPLTAAVIEQAMLAGFNTVFRLDGSPCMSMAPEHSHVFGVGAELAFAKPVPVVTRGRDRSRRATIEYHWAWILMRDGILVFTEKFEYESGTRRYAM
jgi:hypothetical protein